MTNELLAQMERAIEARKIGFGGLWPTRMAALDLPALKALLEACGDYTPAQIEAGMKLAGAIDKYSGPSPEAYEALMEFRAAKQKGV